MAKQASKGRVVKMRERVLTVWAPERDGLLCIAKALRGRRKPGVHDLGWYDPPDDFVRVEIRVIEPANGTRRRAKR